MPLLFIDVNKMLLYHWEMKEWNTFTFSPKVNNSYLFFIDFLFIYLCIFYRVVDEIWVHISKNHFSVSDIVNIFLGIKIPFP